MIFFSYFHTRKDFVSTGRKRKKKRKKKVFPVSLRVTYVKTKTKIKTSQTTRQQRLSRNQRNNEFGARITKKYENE